jgi:hypothetical protein
MDVGVLVNYRLCSTVLDLLVKFSHDCSGPWDQRIKKCYGHARPQGFHCLGLR